jgi:HPt (histidine-containing phosphotransfer) domain-containing protein
MTANAMDSDRDACLAAGMNGHVGKPFDLNHLIGVLQLLAAPSWTRPGGRGNDPLRQAQGERAENPFPARADSLCVRAEPVEAVRSAAQAAGVDLHGALNRLGHNQALYQRTLRVFVADLLAMPAPLRAHELARDAAQTSRLLHTLKGLAATLGVTALAGVAGEGEALLKSQIDRGTASVDLSRVVARTCAAIEQAIPGLTTLQTALQGCLAAESDGTGPVAHAAPLDTASLALRLTALADKLGNSDMDAVQVMATLKQQFGAALQGPTHERLDSLEAAVDALDFDRAQTICHTWLASTEATSP